MTKRFRMIAGPNGSGKSTLANLLRRDEIKFVERDSKEHTSTLFALSDFGTAGENGVRKNDDYLKSYLANQYGGIADVDFSSVFEKLNDAGNGV